MITKRQLQIEIEELNKYNSIRFDEIENLKSTIKELRDRIKILENPPLFKIGDKIGDYIIIEYVGEHYMFGLCNGERYYKVLNKEKIEEITESELIKIKDSFDSNKK